MGAPSAAVVAGIIGPATAVTRRVAIYEADGVTPWASDNGFLLLDGSISVDYSRAERRTLDLSLENTDGVLNHDPNGFWYDKVIKVFRGAVVGSETWETQIGEYVIDTIRQANFPHVVRITGRDYTKRCLLSKFKQATTFTSGNVVVDVIKAMALNAGVTKFVFPSDAAKVLTRDAAFERGTGRWVAMSQLANDYNYELFFDPQGYLVLRDFQDPLTSPLIWTFKTGVDGTLVDYEKVTNDSRIYNSIIVTGSAADGTLVWAQATNTEPSSPTRIARLGERNYFYTSGFITTTQQAQDVADSFLKIHALEEYELSLSSVVLPWLEVGGIIGFTDPSPSPGDPSRYLLTTMSIPLGLGAMTATGKRITVVQ